VRWSAPLPRASMLCLPVPALGPNPHLLACLACLHCLRIPPSCSPAHPCAHALSLSLSLSLSAAAARSQCIGTSGGKAQALSSCCSRCASSHAGVDPAAGRRRERSRLEHGRSVRCASAVQVSPGQGGSIKLARTLVIRVVISRGDLRSRFQTCATHETGALQGVVTPPCNPVLVIRCL
jgi:hypothetical protein